MKILIIDDEPTRCHKLVRAGHYVSIAHTVDQMFFWLTHGPWDLIILDNDLGDNDMSKLVTGKIGEEVVGAGCPVRVWSLNPVAAPHIKAHLERKADEYGIDIKIDILPWTHDNGSCLNDDMSFRYAT